MLAHRLPYKHYMCGFLFESFLLNRSPCSFRRPCSLLFGVGDQPDCSLLILIVLHYLIVSFLLSVPLLSTCIKYESFK